MPAVSRPRTVPLPVHSPGGAAWPVVPVCPWCAAIVCSKHRHSFPRGRNQTESSRDSPGYNPSPWLPASGPAHCAPHPVLPSTLLLKDQVGSETLPMALGPPPFLSCWRSLVRPGLPPSEMLENFLWQTTDLTAQPVRCQTPGRVSMDRRAA